MKTYIKTLFFVMIGLFALSCNNKLSKETSYVLYYEPDSSHVTEKRMIGDSIVIKKISQDSILISTHISNMTVYENLISELAIIYGKNDIGVMTSGNFSK